MDLEEKVFTMQSFIPLLLDGKKTPERLRSILEIKLEK